MKRLILLLIILGVSTMTVSSMEEHKEMPPVYQGSAEFERMKGLTGTWKGMHAMGQESKEVTVEYQVTSNGSAVVERSFPGTPHEMVSVYHDKGGKLYMTHYCSLGNQPEMEMTSSEGNTVNLGFSSDSAIDVATEGHMHSLSLVFGDDQLTQNWSMWEGGQEAMVTSIELTKVK